MAAHTSAVSLGEGFTVLNPIPHLLWKRTKLSPLHRAVGGGDEGRRPDLRRVHGPMNGAPVSWLVIIAIPHGYLTQSKNLKHSRLFCHTLQRPRDPKFSECSCDTLEAASSPGSSDHRLSSRPSLAPQQEDKLVTTGSTLEGYRGPCELRVVGNRLSLTGLPVSRAFYRGPCSVIFPKWKQEISAGSQSGAWELVVACPPVSHQASRCSGTQWVRDCFLQVHAY